MVALDKDRDGTLSKDEIADAPKALKTLDKNSDGMLSRDEHPSPPGPPPRDGPEAAGPDGARRPGRGGRGPRLRRAATTTRRRRAETVRLPTLGPVTRRPGGQSPLGPAEPAVEPGQHLGSHRRRVGMPGLGVEDAAESVLRARVAS